MFPILEFLGVLVVLLALVGITTAAFLRIIKTSRGDAGPSPYRSRTHFLSDNERAFYHVLVTAARDRYTVFAQVRLADIIQVAPAISGNRELSRRHFNQIVAKHADFVLCEPGTLRIVGVIELDDRSHQRPERQRRDEFFDAAMQSAGVPVLRVPARSNQRGYDEGELRTAIGRAFPVAAFSSRPEDFAPAAIGQSPFRKH